MTDPNAFYAALAFYLIPILVGYGIISVIALFPGRERKEALDYQWIFTLFESFAFGALLLYAVKLITGPSQHVFISVLYVLVALAVIAIVAKTVIKRDLKLGLSLNSALVILLVPVLTVIVYGIWRFDSPLKTTLNWDLYHHQTVASLINNNVFYFNTSKVSDTFQFDGYSTMFHLLLSIPQYLLRPDILDFWWYVEAIHLATTILASFLVGYTLSRRTKVGIISAVFGAFIFESSGAYTSLFLIPQNITAALGAVFIVKILRNYQQGTRLIDPSVLGFIIVAALMHTIIGAMIIAVMLGLAGVLWAHQKYQSDKLDNILVILAVSTLVVVPLVASFINLDYMNQGEAVFFNYTLAKKFELMKDFYGFSLLAFLPLGIIYALKEKSMENNVALILFAVLFSVVVAHIPYTMKLYSVGRFFVHALMAMGVWLLIKSFHSVLYAASLALLAIILSIAFTINVVKYKQVPTYKELATHVSTNELKAVDFLKEKYTGRNAIIIGDPGTMQVLEGLSGINSAGGAYASKDTRAILSKVYFSRDSKKIAQELTQIQDRAVQKQPDIYLLAVSGRFEKWQNADEAKKMNIYWNIWTPYDLSPEALSQYDFIDFLKHSDGVTEVYSNNGIVIFEIPRISTQNL